MRSVELKTPGALAGATEVRSETKTASFHGDVTPKRGRSAMSLYGKDAHKRLVKCLGYALSQGTAWAWHGFTTILIARATEAEIAGMVYSGLKALDHDTAYKIASAALFEVLNGEVLS